MTIHEK